MMGQTLDMLWLNVQNRSVNASELQTSFLGKDKLLQDC